MTTPAPEALGHIAALLRDLAGRVERTAWLMDLAAHGRATGGADPDGLAAAELAPIEERAQAWHLELLATLPGDVERALAMLRASAAADGTVAAPKRKRKRPPKRAKVAPVAPEPADEAASVGLAVEPVAAPPPPTGPRLRTIKPGQERR